MKLTRDLRLAFGVETENHGTVQVYSLPIARSTFELYFAELGAVFNECFRAGDPKHLSVVGPRIAFAALKKAAMADGTWDAPGGVENGLVNELIRLTSISVAGPNGWETHPMALAQSRGILDEDSAYEILSALVFTLAASRVGPPKLMEEMMDVVVRSREWALISSSVSVTAYLASLTTSTEGETSTMKPPSATVSVSLQAPASKS